MGIETPGIDPRDRFKASNITGTFSPEDQQKQRQRESYATDVLHRIADAYKAITSSPSSNPTPEIYDLAYALIVQEDAKVENEDAHGGKKEETRPRHVRDREAVLDAIEKLHTTSQ